MARRKARPRAARRALFEWARAACGAPPRNRSTRRSLVSVAVMASPPLGEAEEDAGRAARAMGARLTARQKKIFGCHPHTTADFTYR